MNSVYNIFEQYEMNLVVTIIAIRISGHTAFDYGWHAVNLVASRLPLGNDTSRLGGETPADSGRSISTLTTWTWLPGCRTQNSLCPRFAPLTRRDSGTRTQPALRDVLSHDSS